MMKKIYAMIGVTIVIFLLSFDVIYQTDVYQDIMFVLIYLLLVMQMALDLKTDVLYSTKECSLSEKKTMFFVPMIFMPFLGITIGFGIVAFVINIIVIVLLYVYVFLLVKRNNITVTKKEISVVYLNNKKASMLFSDVVKVDFNWLYNYIEFRNESGEKLILDITVKDFLVVIRAIRDNLPSEMVEETFIKLTKFYKAFLVHSNAEYLKRGNEKR